MNVTITSPFWKRRRDQIVESVIPYQWGVMNDEIDTMVPDDPAGNQLADNKSHAVANLIPSSRRCATARSISSPAPSSRTAIWTPRTRSSPAYGPTARASA